MSNWYNEEIEYAPEPEIPLTPEEASLTIGLSINAGQIEAAIQNHIDSILEDRIKKLIAKSINHSMDNLLKKDYWSQDNVRLILYEVVKARFDSKYPEVEENKVNELCEAIKAMTYKDDKNDQLSAIRQKARARVESYINSELKESVQLSKEYIEQFAKNYFANNLFRAMGMLDKMIPHTESHAKHGELP